MIPYVHDLPLPPEGSVLVTTPASARLFSSSRDALRFSCPAPRSRRHHRGTAYDRPAIAALVSCHRRDHPGSVVTWLYATSPQARPRSPGCLFFYGWNSFVVFQHGKPIARGEWEPSQARMGIDR
jgi:hypothetical protein